MGVYIWGCVDDGVNFLVWECYYDGEDLCII